MNENGSYKTLLKNDPEYRSYLLGTFSAQLVALPVESFGVGTERERTTFLVLSKDQVKKPFWPLIYLAAIRPELLGLTLGHAVLAMLALRPLVEKHFSSVEDFFRVGALPMFLCLVVTVLAHASACLFNDYQDHLNGTDRKSLSHGSRVIQKAWSRAVEVRRWAFVNAFFALLIGLYLLWGNWWMFVGLAVLTAAAIHFYARMTPFWNKWGAGDFWITLLFGPLLFFSVWFSILTQENFLVFSREMLVDGILISLPMGLLASWTLQVRQFQDIFKREEGSFRSLISRMNFDQAKFFLVAEGALFFFAQPVVFYMIWKDPGQSGVLAVGAALACAGLFILKNLASPLSSRMLKLNRLALSVHAGFLLLWIEALWVR